MTTQLPNVVCDIIATLLKYIFLPKNSPFTCWSSLDFLPCQQRVMAQHFLRTMNTSFGLCARVTSTPKSSAVSSSISITVTSSATVTPLKQKRLTVITDSVTSIACVAYTLHAREVPQEPPCGRGESVRLICFRTLPTLFLNCHLMGQLHIYMYIKYILYSDNLVTKTIWLLQPK